ncbi:hypothetical protein ACEN9F_30660 [Duganella sp. CT11-25]|uniref:hypothetical protein n=1 Tax=unclassified Duganella TaxID=2636909 RepID=UPI0039AFC335
MIVVTQNAGLFGPFASAELLADRVLCDGAEIPFTVVGACTLLDIEVPAGKRAEDYDLVDGALVRKNPAE